MLTIHLSKIFYYKRLQTKETKLLLSKPFFSDSTHAPSSALDSIHARSVSDNTQAPSSLSDIRQVQSLGRTETIDKV